jgi:hypothetical protein
LKWLANNPLTATGVMAHDARVILLAAEGATKGRTGRIEISHRRRVDGAR